METPPPNPRWKGLGTRIFGVLPLLAVVIICVLFGGVLFVALTIMAAIIMLREWDRLTAMEGRMLKLLGYPLIIAPCACLIWLRSVHPQDQEGTMLVFYLIAIIAATDIGAYFTGKRLGRHRLAPVISPNKTWEGLLGGMLCAALVAAFCLPYLPVVPRLLVGAALALLAQAGDILESWVKRRAGVKDSGTLIPGHGGLLDRLDGYLLAAPAYTLLYYCLTVQ